MKITLYVLAALALISCGRDSDVNVASFSTPLNFSETKYNEELLGEFAIPNVQKVVANLEAVKSKTANCKNTFTPNGLKQNWTEAVMAYQQIRPLELTLLDRNPETSSQLRERYLGGAFSANKCDLQKNTAAQLFLKDSLVRDPALNSLEFLIFSNPLDSNSCKGAQSDAVETWLTTDDKAADLCRHINFIADLASKQLKEINRANRALYQDGRTDEIFAADDAQSVYDSISVFIDQVLKDDKLGEPLGLSAACPFEGRTCPNAVEHILSNLTFESISKNLEGIMAVYNSKTTMDRLPQPRGLYQFLTVNKKADVAKDFYNNLLEAHKLSTELHGQSLSKIAEALDGESNKEQCLNTNLQNRTVPACVLFQSIKSLSDKVKKDLRLALAVSRTKQTEGDSD